MQEELYALQKMQNGITFTVSNNITPCFIYGLRFGITDFKQMKVTKVVLRGKPKNPKYFGLH
jgi:hypothetical protein